jgi:hypothetical protein
VTIDRDRKRMMATHPSDSFLSCGLVEPVELPWQLECGPLQLQFHAGELRYVRVNGREALRRVYAAVRDRNWLTIPGQLSEVRCEATAEEFRITYHSAHRHRAIDFHWDGSIVGRATGEIDFSFDGEARSTFERNRIGFCVLHPSDSCSGAACRAAYADGRSGELRFPRTIASEQPVHGFTDLIGLAHQIDASTWLEIRFEGDLFETEDQRNWIDASFKTFCTPLRRPFPVEVKRGERIEQRIRIRVLAAREAVSPAMHHAIDRRAAVRIRRDEPASPQRVVVRRQPGGKSVPRPPIGSVYPSDGPTIDDVTRSRLAALGLSHVRIDCRLTDQAASWSHWLQDAQSIAPDIELAVHLDGGSTAEQQAMLRELRRVFRQSGISPRRVLALGGRSDRSTTDSAWRLVKDAFQPSTIPVGVGTDADLYQMNLQPPPSDGDFVFWSMNPQVHAFDCASIAETPAAAREQLQSVADDYPGKPLVVTPVTLKPRFNPVAIGPAATPAAGELPDSVDPRQMSLFAAGWTAAMLGQLIAGLADSVTIFETSGWRGLLETAHGSRSPARFPSQSGWVFPVFHVLADLLEWPEAEVIELETSEPLHVHGLIVQRRGRTPTGETSSIAQRLILANLQATPCVVEIAGFKGPFAIRRLDLSNVRSALNGPAEHRGQWQQFEGNSVTMPPFGLLTADVAAEPGAGSNG